MSNGIVQVNGNSQQQLFDLLFQSILKNKPCFVIWRIENMQLVSVPKEAYGTFYKGDTYLVYSCTESSNKLFSYHIHLWIGGDTSTDEQCVGAFKMVELDDYLGGSPIQHRECQNFESERFFNYFKGKGGIRYLNGGIASGFNHVDKIIEPRLFLVKGKRNIRLTELPNMDWTVLNRNDSFLIDLNTTIFIWNGRNSNKLERLQALNKARQFRESRNGNCNIVIVEDNEEKEMSKDELKLFESKFPLKEKVAKLRNDPPANVYDDLKFEKEVAGYLKLYKCCDAVDDEDGTVKIKIIEQKTGPLNKDDLCSDDSYIVDNGRTGIWVWIGRRSSGKERQEAMRNALGFLQAKGYDERQQNAIKVTRVIDGSEPVEFRALFNRWPETNEQKGIGRSHSSNSVAKTVQSRFDASILHLNHQLAAESQMFDDGKGLKEIWFVQNFNLNKMNETKFGEFHSGDCYIIHYQYKINNSEKHILYYWIGRKSSLDEQGTVVLKTIEFDNKILNGQALQVRVIEGKEPNHFMAMFDGRIVIYQGGKASGFHNSNEVDTDKLPENYMLQVRNYGNYNIKAIQVDYKASSLNSNDVFIICFKSNSFYIWSGKGSTGDERETAKQLVLRLKKEPKIVIESQEKDEFWQVLGGKQNYYSDKRLQTSNQANIIRLFEISNASGKFNVQEVLEFTQDDLNASEVMLLDAWDTIFLWIGSGANKIEIDESEKIVFDYLKSDPSQRGIDIPIFKVRQGHEPPNFTGFFGPWDPNAFQNVSNYSDLKNEVHSKNQSHLFLQAVKEKSSTSIEKSTTQSFNESKKYSYEILAKPADELPKDVNVNAKELHLSEEEFAKLFKMSFQQFLEKPTWKQKQMKRDVHLF